MSAQAEGIFGVIKRVEAALREREVAPGFEEFNMYQRKALSKILRRLLADGRVSGVLQMPTGTGKTILAAGPLLSLSMGEVFEGLFRSGVTALFLSPRIVIRRQSIEKLERALSDRFSVLDEVEGGDKLLESVSRLRGRVPGWPSGGVIFATPPAH